MIVHPLRSGRPVGWFTIAASRRKHTAVSASGGVCEGNYYRRRYMVSKKIHLDLLPPFFNCCPSAGGPGRDRTFNKPLMRQSRYHCTTGPCCPSFRAAIRSIPNVVWSGDTPSGALFSRMISERSRSLMLTQVAYNHPTQSLVCSGYRPALSR